ncbi:MAG: hypothetical protein IPN46_18165 [Saprospiraceae bacterium]|nr:hypothetical protein [Saprospiraceae bacterium]
MLKESGKVREFGVVNFHRIRSVLYPDFILFLRTKQRYPLPIGPLMDGTIDTCMAHDMVPMSWSPLGGSSIYTNTKAGKN